MSNASGFALGLALRSFDAPAFLSQIKLVAFDMDSTLINIECVDEIADTAGRVVDLHWVDIYEGEEKRKTQLQTCQLMGFAPSQAIAMGHGAHDLPMMGVAGLSVA